MGADLFVLLVESILGGGGLWVGKPPEKGGFLFEIFLVFGDVKLVLTIYYVFRFTLCHTIYNILGYFGFTVELKPFA